jgi:MbtH protein
MSGDDHEDQTVYKVVLNHEEQYSIWPADRSNALGWRDGGLEGTKAECLAYIDRVWTDMRPLSLRKRMQAEANAKPEPTSSAEPSALLSDANR